MFYCGTLNNLGSASLGFSSVSKAVLVSPSTVDYTECTFFFFFIFVELWVSEEGKHLTCSEMTAL